MIEWIPHDDRCRVPPESIGYVVRAMEWPTSKSIAETSNYMSIDYIPVGSDTLSVALHHFMKIDDSWISCTWADLSDDHRLIVRTDTYAGRYPIGRYKDHRYYILESLT